MTVGAAADNDVQVDGLSPHHLRLTLQPEGYYRVEAVDAGATLAQKEKETRSIELRSGSFQAGRYTLSLSPAAATVLLVSDPQHPRLAAFQGLAHFPLERDLRMVAPLQRDESKTIVEFAATQGTVQAEGKGWFDLTLDGASVRLEVHRLISPSVRGSELIVLFRDATSGNEASALGRQVEPLPLPDGEYVHVPGEAPDAAPDFVPPLN